MYKGCIWAISVLWLIYPIFTSFPILTLGYWPFLLVLTNQVIGVAQAENSGRKHDGLTGALKVQNPTSVVLGKMENVQQSQMEWGNLILGKCGPFDEVISAQHSSDLSRLWAFCQVRLFVITLVVDPAVIRTKSLVLENLRISDLRLKFLFARITDYLGGHHSSFKRWLP